MISCEILLRSAEAVKLIFWHLTTFTAIVYVANYYAHERASYQILAQKCDFKYLFLDVAYICKVSVVPDFVVCNPPKTGLIESSDGKQNTA